MSDPAILTAAEDAAERAERAATIAARSAGSAERSADSALIYMIGVICLSYAAYRIYQELSPMLLKSEGVQ